MSVGSTSESLVRYETLEEESNKKLQPQAGRFQRNFVGPSTFQAAIEAIQANSDLTLEQKEDRVKYLQRQIRIPKTLTADNELHEDVETKPAEEQINLDPVHRRGGFIGVAAHEAALEVAKTNPDLTPEQRIKEVAYCETHIALYTK